MMEIPQMPKIITVHSQGEGVGKTTLATLIALGMSNSSRNPQKVCLIDLNTAAPSLDRVLGVESVDWGVLDYVMAGPTGKAKSVKEVCVNVSPGFEGAQDMYLLPSKVDFEQQYCAEGYVLSEHFGGMLEARLTYLLKEVSQAHPDISCFVIDTPSGILGVSGAVMGAAERYPRSQHVFVTDARYVTQLRAMLQGRDKLREGITKYATSQKIVYRHKEPDPEKALAEAASIVGDSEWLEEFRFGVLADSEVIAAIHSDSKPTIDDLKKEMGCKLKFYDNGDAT